MTWKFPAVNKLVLLLTAGALRSPLASPRPGERPAPRNMTSAAAQYGGGPNVVYQQGPRTRVYVTKRSWLDGGTEVLPGDRKFTDYAYPAGCPSFARDEQQPSDRPPAAQPAVGSRRLADALPAVLRIGSAANRLAVIDGRA